MISETRLSVLVRGLQRSKTNRSYIYYIYGERERFILGLIHMIMEAKKSHALPFASWRTKKAGGVVQSNSKGPVIGEPMA